MKKYSRILVHITALFRHIQAHLEPYVTMTYSEDWNI